MTDLLLRSDDRDVTTSLITDDRDTVKMTQNKLQKQAFLFSPHKKLQMTKAFTVFCESEETSPSSCLTLIKPVAADQKPITADPEEMKKEKHG